MFEARELWLASASSLAFKPCKLQQQGNCFLFWDPVEVLSNSFSAGFFFSQLVEKPQPCDLFVFSLYNF